MKANGEHPLWAIVTATSCQAGGPHGGGGETLTRPAAYRTIIGTRPMLRHAMDRALLTVPAERLVIVYTAEHRRCLEETLGPSPPGLIVEQPEQRGGVATVLFGLVQILERSPEATIVVLPADHFVHPERAFLNVVAEACDIVDASPERLVVLGAKPIDVEAHADWLTTGSGSSATRGGPLLNTGVLIGRASTVWEAVWQQLPDMAHCFSLLRHAIRLVLTRSAPAEHEALARALVYQNMGWADLSLDFLRGARKSVHVLRMGGVLWSDWSQPGRAARTIEWMHRGRSGTPWQYSSHGSDQPIRE